MKSIKSPIGAALTRAIVVYASLAGFMASPLHAANSTWTDTAANNAWSTTTNWSPTGVPTATSTAVFDTGGNTSPVTVGTQAVGTIQFGQASETTPTAIAYTLGTGTDTLNFSTSNFNIVNYLGSGNTATQTINSNVVLNFGDTDSSGTNTYTINNTSSGNLVFNQSLSNADVNVISNLNLTTTVGNVIFNGNVSLNGTLNAMASVGTSVTFNGTNSNASLISGNLSYINLGTSSSPNTNFGSYGNLIFTNSTGINNLRITQTGSQGTVIFNSPTGVTGIGNGGYLLFLEGSHSSESNPNVEFASGNNYFSGNNVLDVAAGQTLANSSYYIKVDAGASLVAGMLYDAAPASLGTQTTYLYGGGNGVIYDTISSRNTGNTNLIVKDGTGTWAINGNAGSGAGGNVYNGLTVEDGTMLINGTGAGQGNVVVDPTNSQDVGAKPILGGTGSFASNVTINSGGTFAPGGAASSTAGAVITNPIGNIGSITVAGNLTGNTGATFAFDINSSGAFTAGKGSSDTINVTGGSLSLNNATLAVSDLGSTALSSGSYFDLINYNGYDLSTFNGLAEGAQVTVGANVYTIDYTANSFQAVYLNWLSAVPFGSAYWTGGSGVAPASWATSSNFLDGPAGSPLAAAPNSTTNVSFSANASGNFNTTLDGSYTINSLNFGAGTNASSAVTVAQGTGSGKLTINGGGIVVASGAGNATISAPVALGANQMWSNNSTNALAVSGAVSGAGALALQNMSTGTISLTGGITSTGNLVLQNASTGSISLSGGSVNPTGSITNSGAGAGSSTISSVIGTNVTSVTQNSATSSLILSGANTYTGPTTITSGTLVAKSSQALGAASAPLTLSGGTLDLQTAGTTAYNTTVNVNSTIISDSAGATQTLGNLSLGNGTTSGSVTLTVNAANGGTGVAFGQTTLTGGAAITATGTTVTLGNLLTNNFTLTLSGTGGNFVQTGAWTGSGALTFNGTGTLTLNQANTFAGLTTLSGSGTVIASNSQSLGTNAALTLSGSNGRLDLQVAPAVAYNVTVSNNYFINVDNTTSGAGQTYTFGTLSIGSKTIAAAVGANNTGGGGLVFGATTITGNAGISAASGLTISLGAASIGSGDTINANGSGGTVIQTDVWSGAGSVAVNTNAANVLNLNQANTYTGTTTVAAGTLLINNAGTSSTNSAIGTSALTITGGTINNTTGGAITLATNNAINLNGTATFGSSTATAANSINFGTGAVTLTANRTVAFTTGSLGDTITFGGTTTNTATSGITLTVNTAGNTLALGNYILSSASTAAINDTFNGTGNIAINGVVSNGSAFANGLIYSGSGTLTLSGANTYTGATSITGGTVIARNANSLGGNATTNNVTVSGASTTLDYFAATDAQLAIGGNLTLTGGTSTAIGASIGSTTTSSEINVTGKATATSTVKVNVYGEGITVASGTNNYVLINAAGAGSTLNGATYSLGTIYNDSNFTIGALSSTTTQLLLSITQGTALTSAYWNGAYTGNTNVWAASNGTNLSNWASSLGGGTQNLTPSATTTVFISNTGSITTAPTATVLGANMSIAGLVIQDTVNGLGLKADGNTLTIGTGGITMNASVPASFIAANVGLNGNQTWKNSSANALTVSGVVSGSGNLTIGAAGATGTIILSGANIYTGTTTLTTGTLVTTSSQALGTGALKLNGGTLDAQGLSASNATTVSASSTIKADTLAAAGGVGVTNTLGTLSIGAQILTVSGGSNVTSGTAGVTFGAVTATDAATFTVNNPAGGGTTLLTLASITPTAGKTLTFNGTGNTTVTGVIGGTTAPLTMSGTGTLTLGGTNTYTGATTLTSGTLVSQAAGALGTSAAALKLNGGVLDLQAGSTTSYATTIGGNVTILSDALPTSAGAAANYNLGNVSMGAQTLTIGAGAYVSSGTGSITLNGTTTLTGAAHFSVGAGSYLRMGNLTNAGFTPTFTGAGNFSQTSNNTVWSGNGGVTFDSNFTGLAILGQKNTYLGPTTIQNGSLNVNGVAAAGTAQGLGGGTVLNVGLANTSSATVNFTQGGLVTLSGFTINILGNGGDTLNNTQTGPTNSLTLSGGSIVKNGTTLTLKGNINIAEVISGSAANSDLNYSGATSTVSVAGTYNGPTRMYNGSTVTSGANDALADIAGGASANTSLTLGDSSEITGYTNTFVLNGFNQTLGGLTSNTAYGDSNSVIGGSATLSTLNLAIASGTNTYTGLLGSATAGATNNNNLAVTKSGSGTLALTGGNNYTGGTTVSAGTLSISNTSGSATGTGAVAVSGSSTVLKGRGEIDGAVTLSSGATLSSGSTATGTGPGTGMTLTSTLSVSSSNLTFQLSNGTTTATFANPNMTTSFLNLGLNGTISFTGTDAINLVDLSNGGLTLRMNAPYLLISAASNSAFSGLVTVNSTGQLALNGNGTVLGVWQGGALTNYTAITLNEFGSDGVTPLDHSTTAGNGYYAPSLYLINGNLEVVPEPGTWALMIGGLALLVFIQRRRKQN